MKAPPPDLPDDPGPWVNEGPWTRHDQLAARRADAKRHERPTPAAAVSVCYADVEPEDVRWLWPGRIALGKLTVLDGDPGLGKSTLTVELAARGSQGRPLPGAPALGERFATLLLSAEDGHADTIVRRLRAHDADLALVHALLTVAERTDGERLPSIPGDVAVLRDEIARLKGVCGVSHVLLVIDPLVAYLGSTTDAHKDSDVRRALAPLARLAQETASAVVLVRHLNKGSGSALHRGGGSIAIAGAARSVLLVAKDPDDENQRVIAPVKSNLAHPAPALRFRLVDCQGIGRLEWLGEASVTADQLVVPPDPQQVAEVHDAVSWLSAALANGPVAVKQLQGEAKAQGIGWRTLERAKKRLGVRADRDGYTPDKGWRWSL